MAKIRHLAETWRYKSHDPLAAEFIRTFRHRNFPGKFFLERYEALCDRAKTIDVRILLPKNAAGKGVTDQVSLYGFRSTNPDLFYLSPWEFVQWVIPVRLRPPAADYQLTILTAAGRSKKNDAGQTQPLLEAGVDFVLNEKFAASLPHVFRFPVGNEAFPGQGPVTYKKFRHTDIAEKNEASCSLTRGMSNAK